MDARIDNQPTWSVSIDIDENEFQSTEREQASDKLELTGVIDVED